MSSESNPWKYIVIGCGIISLIACCCGTVGFFACGGAMGAAMGAPYGTTHAFFAAARTGQTDTAYALTSPAFQAAHPQPGFAAELAALPGATTHTDVTVQNVNVQNTEGTVSGSLTTPSGSLQFVLELADVGPEPRIRAITIGDQTLR